MKRLVLVAVLVLTTVACSGDTVVTVGPDALPQATVGQPYSVDLSATEASGAKPGPLNVSVTKGSLPAGINTVQPPGNGTGAPGLRGTPTTAGSYSFTLELGGYCTMGGCVRGSRDYTLVVNP